MIKDLKRKILKHLKKGQRQKNPFIFGNFPIWSFSGFFSFLFSVIPLHEPYSSCCVLLQNGQRFEIEASQAPKGKLVKDRQHENYYFLRVYGWGGICMVKVKLPKVKLIIKHLKWAGQVLICGFFLYVWLWCPLWGSHCTPKNDNVFFAPPSF